ncbi:MAG TPA: sigma-70 family RNA polymerase sigma factor [Terriglobales bacterium]|nr:sigma-70 family RNA polymerase sigma factor [Terriglobales bacterium]
MAIEARSSESVAGPSPTRDAGLIARILAGERELFHELVRPYEKGVYRATFSILQNAEDAEDAAQEAMLKALRNLRHFRSESRFSTWLISIAVNEARARLRHARVLKFDSIDEPPEEEENRFTPALIRDWREVPLQALERSELREMLRKAIASLPEIYREVLVMRDIEELSIAETAAALSVREGVVKTRLLRARLMMQKILAPQLATRRSSGLFALFGSKAGGSWF